jgi:hypothetical protein
VGGDPTPRTSPWVQIFGDYLNRTIRITVTFDEGTRAITGITVSRDAGCLFSHILIGLGADGVPDSTDKSVAVPFGTTTLTAQQINVLANHGLSTIEDIPNITAGL